MRQQEQDTKFVPIPADFFTTKTGRKLFRAGPIHQLRFLWLVFKAHSLGRDGALAGSDMEPLDVEDIAEDHDRDVEGWQLTIEICHELNLVETDSRGILKIAHIEYWHRPPSDRPEATRERKRKQREREREATESQPESQECHGGHEESRESRPRTEENRTETEEIRSDLDQTTEQKRTEETREVDPLGLPVCRSSFVKFAQTAHERVAGSPLSKSELASLEKLVSSPPWSGYSWRDRAGAMLTAELQMEWEAERGKAFINAWFYLLTAAASYLKQAKDVNRANDFAVRKGYTPMPHAYEAPEQAAQ